MEFYFKDTEQRSSIARGNEAYKFKLPEFGKSTTDPTFYEPMATTIANMKNSAVGSGKSLYDFTDSTVNIDKVHIMVGRKPGMTIEEISQINTLNEAAIKEDIKEYEAQNKKKADDLENIVDISKAIDKSKSEEVASE